MVEALQGPQRDTIARNARKYVEDHHSWPTLLEDIDRYLDALNPADTARPRRSPAPSPASVGIFRAMQVMTATAAETDRIAAKAWLRHGNGLGVLCCF